jgi:hypothetical protein
MSLIIDSGSGTMLTAHTCYLVPDDAFTEAEWDDIENFSDSEMGRIGRENGIPVSKSEQLLHSIADAIQAERPDLVASRI